MKFLLCCAASDVLGETNYN